MAYFLKKAKQSNNIYLAIYESFYSRETNGTKHKCYKSLGSVTKLMESGIEDPIAYFQAEVDKLNEERNKEKVSKKHKEIGDSSPLRHLGYFPLSMILNKLDVDEHFENMQSTRNFDFNVFEIFKALVFARAVNPCSKRKTYHDVLPCLFNKIDYSYDQLLDCIEFIGSEYERFNEIFTVATKENYGLDTDKTYFDCTNFYFEIDREDDLRRKGPSKENRRDPIVGLGLLLDKNLIPIGMKIYPGNESEKPVIRNIISDLKKQNNIKGRTIQIADKGLNCAKNIHEATKKGDGYLFSKSVKQLKGEEKDWVLLDNDYKEFLDNDGTVKYKYKSCIEEFEYKYNDENGNTIIFKVREKRLCTYNATLARKQLREIEKLENKAKAMCLSQAVKSEFGECGKYVDFKDKDGKKAYGKINQDKIDNDKKIAGYNLLVTSEITMNDNEIYDGYHQLWAIEQSFRIMKSELEARPVYLQKENSIKGHFFICYIGVLLSRLLQFKELNGEYPITQIFEFIREFNVVKSASNSYINMSKRTAVLEAIVQYTNQPLLNYYLTEKQIRTMHTR